jgi:hypothetical protein
MCIKACNVCKHETEDKETRFDKCGLTQMIVKWPHTHENRDCGGFVKREEVKCANCMYRMHLKVLSPDGAVCDSEGVTDEFITCLKKVSGTSYLYGHEYWDIPGTGKGEGIPRYMVQQHDEMLVLRRKEDYCADLSNHGCL